MFNMTAADLTGAARASSTPVDHKDKTQVRRDQ
jgi:hypothetical protein